MALTTIPGGLITFPGYALINFATSPVTLNTLTATGYQAAGIFRIPPAMSGLTITAVGFLTGTVSGTSPTVTVSLQTLSSGNPSGTNYGGSAASSNITVASNTFYEGTLGTAATVAVGDVISAVVKLTGGTTPSVIITAENVIQPGAYPYTDAYTTSWTTKNYTPLMWVKTSDGNYWATGMWPANTSSIAYKNTSSPNKYALKFQIPVPCRAYGFYIVGTFVGTSNFTVKLYASDGSTVLSTYTPPTTITANTVYVDGFSSTVNLSANTTYYLSLEATSSSTNTTLNYLFCYSTAILNMLSGGAYAYQSSATTPPTWTDDTTKRPCMGVLIDQFDNGAGGSSSGISLGRVLGGM